MVSNIQGNKEGRAFCTCHTRPDGRHGLEGYQIGQIYEFEYMPRDKDGKPYMRVYLMQGDAYYETCGVLVFKKYFEILQD